MKVVVKCLNLKKVKASGNEKGQYEIDSNIYFPVKDGKCEMSHTFVILSGNKDS